MRKSSHARLIEDFSLFVAAIIWTLLSATVAGGDPWPTAFTFLGSGLCFGVVRLRAEKALWFVPAIAAAAGFLSAIVFSGDLPSNRPHSGPLGYENASAALYLQATIAILMLSGLMVRQGWRSVALVSALVMASITIMADSRAVDALLVLTVLSLVSICERTAKILIGLLSVLVPLALSISIVLGATYSSGKHTTGVETLVDRSLSERRPALWRDCLTMMTSHPVSGVGPGRFERASPLAVSDSDARWAHNGFLQQGAEGGLVAMIILVLIFGLGFFRLYHASTPARIRILGAVSLAALGIHANIDYVLHFPSLCMLVSAMVAGASAETRNGERA